MIEGTGVRYRDLKRWERGWVDPRRPFGPPHGSPYLWYPWPLVAPPVDRSWAMWQMQGMKTPDWRGYGHARWVWLMEQATVVSSKAGKGSVDADMAFLALLGAHVRGCRGWCVLADPNGGRTTGEAWLWRAVMRVPRLSALATPLDGEMGDGDDG